MKRARKDHRTRVGKERSARTETRILQAALRVFAERGPDAPVIDDFVQAANISRGTFYNHFDSVEELLIATSEWTTRDILESIEDALVNVDGAAMRFGLGMRMFFAHALRDPLWSQFVAQVWRVGGLELPLRDIDKGVRSGQFHVRGRDAAHDVVLGGIREALHRIGAKKTPAAYGDQVTATCLQALAADPARIAAVLAHPLPELPDWDAHR